MAQAAEEQKNPEITVPDRETHTTEAESPEGRHVISQFYNAIPAQEDIKEWYAGFTPEGYNEWARVVNFTEPQHIID